MTEQDKVTIEEGTISFWIKENSIVFNDGKATPLANINPSGGSIFIVKDGDNKLKVMFVVLGKGRIDIEHDVANINSAQRHLIVFTWNCVDDKKINLYIDGELVKTENIGFN